MKQMHKVGCGDVNDFNSTDVIVPSVRNSLNYGNYGIIVVLVQLIEVIIRHWSAVPETGRMVVLGLRSV